MTDENFTRSDECTKLREIILYPRPVMLVGSSRFEWFANFIEGFAFANADARKELRLFEQWLTLKVKLPRNVGWWGNLRREFPDDAEALQAMRDLYQEFLTSIETTSRYGEETSIN